MRGKYSPTVTEAYMRNQDWWEKLSSDGLYDVDGFDSYGYDFEEKDRAGNYEHDYYMSDEFGDNYRYEQALHEWSFDGTRPAKTK